MSCQQIVVTWGSFAQRGDSADRVAAEVYALFRRRIIARDVRPRPRLTGLMASLVDEGIRIAVATTGQRAWVESLLMQLLGDGIVETVVTGDDVGR